MPILGVVLTVPLLVAVPSAPAQPPATPKGRLDVTALGAKADGKNDDTAAIQKALDVAA